MNEYTELVQTRLTKDQLKALKERAYKHGFTIAGYIRFLIIKALTEAA